MCQSNSKEPGDSGTDQGQSSSPDSARPGFVAAALIAAVRFYQRGLSPLLGKNCRFQPSCSQYMIEAIRKYGTCGGTLRGLRRILRCHPFSKGGYDPP